MANNWDVNPLKTKRDEIERKRKEQQIIEEQKRQEELQRQERQRKETSFVKDWINKSEENLRFYNKIFIEEKQKLGDQLNEKTKEKIAEKNAIIQLKKHLLPNLQERDFL